MKKVLLIALSFLIIRMNAISQIDSFPKPNPIYWTIELGTSLLTNTDIVKNKPFKYNLSTSGSWYFYYDLPVGMKKSQKLNYGLSLAPGFGLEFNTFSIDKKLIEVQGNTEFINFSPDYLYSYFRVGFIDIPIDFRYLTKPNVNHENFGFELGGKIGYLIFTEKEFAIENGNDIIRTTTLHLTNFNKLRYGFSGKLSYRLLKISKDKKEYIGMALSILANYYPSELFKDGQGIKSQYYSIGLGISFIFK